MRIRDISVDFDGTLTLEDNYPIIKELNEPLLSLLKEFQSLGGRIVLNTAREGQQLSFALQALSEVGFKPDCVNDNLPYRIKKYRGANCRKVCCDLMIDNRCIDYTGDVDKYRKVLIEDNEVFQSRAGRYLR